MNLYRLLPLFSLSLPMAVGVASPARVAAQAPATAPVITPARIAEINAFIRRHGVAREMGGRTNAQLGLTEPGVRYMVCQLTFIVENRRHHWSIHQVPRAVVHAFWIENDNAAAWVFDLNGNLLTAGILNAGQFQVIPVDQARASFTAEMRLWTDVQLAQPRPSPDQPRWQPCPPAAATP